MPSLQGFARDVPRRLVEILDQSPWTRLTDAEPSEIELGACVRVSLSGRNTPSRMTEEGVVIEVVLPGQEVQSARVGKLRTPIADEERYVVQCWSRRVLRHASDLILVTL